jgi:hypothetical protein
VSRSIRQLWPTLDRRDLVTDQPLVPLARRRTGVKNSGGTARDVGSLLGAVEAADQPDAGSRSSQGSFIVATSTRVRFVRSPPGSPGGTISQASKCKEAARTHSRRVMRPVKMRMTVLVVAVP